MKNIVRTIILSALLITSTTATLSAQKLVVGGRAPELKVKKWLAGTPATDGKNIFIEFYHSANQKSSERLTKLNELASMNRSNLVVIVISREEGSVLESTLMSGSPAYHPAIDEDGKTFGLFGVQYVPYSVLFDKRGRIIWLGNPTSMPNSEIIGFIN